MNASRNLKKIDKFLSILNKRGVGKIIKNEKSKNGWYGYNPYNLVATIIYCFSKFKSSLREIESLCKYDLRVMYLMNQKQPSHNAIKEYINKYIVPYQYEIFTMITKAIIDEFNLDICSIPNGKVKRLSKEQKNYKLAYKYLIKLLEYEKKKKEYVVRIETHVIKQIKMLLQ